MSVAKIKRDEDTIKKAKEIAENIRKLSITFDTGGSMYASRHLDALNDLIDKFTHSLVVVKKGTPTIDALGIIKEYTWLASNGYAEMGDSLLSQVESWKGWYNKLLEEKNQLKKDNEELIGKYYKLQGKSDYVTEQFERLLKQLGASYKEAHPI